MEIHYDAVPLISRPMTGVGYYTAGLVTAYMKLFPLNKYIFDFFAFGDYEEKHKLLSPYLGKADENIAKSPGRLFRALGNFLPIPYSLFFGKSAEITHFCNYIVPHGVKGKVITTVHDMGYKAYPETVRERTRLLLETGLAKSVVRADIIITISEFSKSEILKYFPNIESKIRVIPCGVDQDHFRIISDSFVLEEYRKKAEINKDYFLYLGTIEPRKNLARLIDAYALFREKFGDNSPDLIIAGSKGWYFEEIIAKADATPGVRILDYVDYDDVPKLMGGAKAFVFPSLYEGFGMPVIEAFSCSVPVVTSAANSLQEVAGDCAVLVDPLNTEDIANGLTRVFDNISFANELSAKGYERSRAYTWENAATMLNEVYKELV
ncbi:MAG: glycosyltransferase family 4 protein [Ruminococcus sp.]|nr:glycosyltransferase family 4 protein [Ruminococcus sp.]